MVSLMNVIIVQIETDDPPAVLTKNMDKIKLFGHRFVLTMVCNIVPLFRVLIQFSAGVYYCHVDQVCLFRVLRQFC